MVGLACASPRALQAMHVDISTKRRDQLRLSNVKCTIQDSLLDSVVRLDERLCSPILFMCLVWVMNTFMDVLDVLRVSYQIIWTLGGLAARRIRNVFLFMSKPLHSIFSKSSRAAANKKAHEFYLQSGSASSFQGLFSLENICLSGSNALAEETS